MSAWVVFPVGALAVAAGIAWVMWTTRHKRLPERIPLGDYVPDEWVAEYKRKNRSRRQGHPRNCGCRSCYERNLRSGGLP